jgi:hypothetical protein
MLLTLKNVGPRYISSNMMDLLTRNLASLLSLHLLHVSGVRSAVSRDLIARGRDRDLRVKGPIRLPTKVLRISTRKTVSRPIPTTI